MLKNLWVYYDTSLSDRLKARFERDFEDADKVVLFTILAYGFIVAFLTSLHHGYFKLGIIGGGLVCALSFLAYKTMKGTLLSRLIMATALTAMMAISIQQSNGLGEGHFLFFLNFTILIRYRDVLPLVLLVGLTVVHHAVFTYCQSVGLDIAGTPLAIFSWGQETELGLVAPLIYHVVIAVLGAVIAGYYILDGNTKFIESNSVQLALEQASEGNLDVEIDRKAQSELSEQSRQFFERLRTFMAETHAMVETLRDRSVKDKASASKRYQHASEQQEQVTQLATAIHQMSASTEEISRNTQETASAIDDVAGKTQTGRGMTVSFQQSIKELADKVDESSSTISELAQNSSKIQGIVATIRGISEQTNLLALNAAIEAARAGEQGRGFAVVADEVRVLSQRTHDSTEEINAMIRSFEQATNSAVANMEHCQGLTGSSVEEATSVSELFDNIAQSIKAINDMAAQIATAAEQQTSVSEDINRNTTTIDDFANEFLNDAKKGTDNASQLAKLVEGIEARMAHYNY
ncbi:Transducer protein MpcT [Saliniradius amylolyticus]|uniref:Transducer protein MpcT n=1 Tax=Saliniradius amylolyticus TaxID=2183582 RepID=A0A2S2E5H6_9ALTE|nr:methyl-accepting chemotaxis protein [Saliniradius amylolyticus]AWL12480.1 Transducer protein MpcT [Saliniradius amylolyticus]